MRRLQILPWEIYKNLRVIEEIEPHWKYRRFNTQCVKCGCIKDKYLHALRYSKTWCSCTNIWWKNKQSHEEIKMRRLYERIIYRCNRQTWRSIKYYLEKWIKCEWNSFEEFYSDMWNKPSPSHSIDRINSNGNYSKENCRWADIYTQNNNRCNNIILENWEKFMDWIKENNMRDYYSSALHYYREWLTLDCIKWKYERYKSKKCLN